MLIGLISGAMGPFSNAPIDTIKTRKSNDTNYLLTQLLTIYPIGLQKATYPPGTSAFSKIADITTEMFRQEGPRAFYKGITPRVLRVAPGQAVVFAVYERVRKIMETLQGSSEDRIHSE